MRVPGGSSAAPSCPQPHPLTHKHGHLCTSNYPLCMCTHLSHAHTRTHLNSGCTASGFRSSQILSSAGITREPGGSSAAAQFCSSTQPPTAAPSDTSVATFALQTTPYSCANIRHTRTRTHTHSPELWVHSLWIQIFTDLVQCRHPRGCQVAVLQQHPAAHSRTH